ncbi:MAG: carboxypeptidase regulatory-like domain-containing protein [Planctomycetota bacterium]
MPIVEPGAVVAAVGADDHRDLAGRATLAREDAGPRAATTTERDGRYGFHGLDPGLYVARAWGAGGALHTEEVLLEAGRIHAIDLALEAAGVLDVRVLDASGRPVAGALLLARRAGGALLPHPGAVRTNRDGHARLSDLPRGTVVVLARHPEKGEGRRKVEVGAEPTKVEVVLGR